MHSTYPKASRDERPTIYKSDFPKDVETKPKQVVMTPDQTWPLKKMWNNQKESLFQAWLGIVGRSVEIKTQDRQGLFNWWAE